VLDGQSKSATLESSWGMDITPMIENRGTARSLRRLVAVSPGMNFHDLAQRLFLQSR